MQQRNPNQKIRRGKLHLPKRFARAPTSWWSAGQFLRPPTRERRRKPSSTKSLPRSSFYSLTPDSFLQYHPKQRKTASTFIHFSSDQTRNSWHGPPPRP